MRQRRGAAAAIALFAGWLTLCPAWAAEQPAPVPVPDAGRDGPTALPGEPSAVDPLVEAMQQLETSRHLAKDGRFADAVPFARRAEEGVEARFGPDSVQTAALVNELGFLLQRAGRLDQALPLYERALAIREKALGAEDPTSITALVILGDAQRRLRRLDQALQSNRRALALREKTLGADHPLVAISLNNLAWTLLDLGQYAEALPLLQRALQIRERTAGADAPETATALNNLAHAYGLLGQNDKAVPLYLRALAISEKASGSEDPQTVNTLGNLAVAYAALGRLDEALQANQRALAIREKTLGPDHLDTATSLSNLADVYVKLGQYERAQGMQERALKIRQGKLGTDDPDTLLSMNNLAGTYKAMGRYDDALAMYEIVLAIRERQEGPQGLDVALSLNNLASQYAALGRYAQALPLQQRALAIREKRLGPEHLETALSLHNLAATEQALGQYRQSLESLQRALAIREKVLGADHPDTASTLNNLGYAYRRLARFDRALPLYERALAIYEKRLGADHPDVAIALTNLAEVHEELGQHELALEQHQRALAIREKSLGPEHKETASSLNNVAAIEKSLGRFDLALPLQLRALAIHEKAVGPAHPDTAISLNNLAHTYRLLNQYDKALPLYERALAIREQVYGPDHPDVAVILNNLGELHGEQGHFALALPLLQRALAIREKAYGPEHPETANSLNNLAETQRGLGRLADALDLHRRALAIREKAFGADDPQVAVSLNNIGALYWTQGAHDAAQAYWLRALPVAAQTRSFETLWRVQSHLRLALAAAGAPKQAIYWGKASVNTIQSARTSLGSVDLELQQSFLDDKRGEYKQLAALLIDAGRLSEAEQVLALLKDYEFRQLLHRGAGAGGQADPVGPEKAVTDEYTAMVDQAIARARELDLLERRARTETLPDQDEARRRALQEEATDWRAQFQQWLKALQARLAGAPAAVGAPAFDRKQVALEATGLQTMVRADPGAVGLIYVVTPDQLSVVIATARGSFGRRIGIRAVELNRRVEALRLALADPLRDPRPASAELYRLLIEPVAADLEAAQARTLVLSLTDNLRYIPFAALYDGSRYLVERYAISQIVAGANQRIEADSESWEVAAFGMTRAADTLPALPGVRVELESIVRGAGRSGGVLPGTIRLDKDFDRSNLEAALRGKHRVVHIGSHFVLRPGSEETSFLLLGDGNHLNLDQIAALDFTGLDQLTLSACDTARGGGVDDNGAEVEGLATIVARQGAASVLASLWPVSDRSTAALMHDFYLGRAQDGKLTRAQALQQAQIRLLHGTGDDAARGAPPFAHPYYWAPFILMGNWL